MSWTWGCTAMLRATTARVGQAKDHGMTLGACQPAINDWGGPSQWHLLLLTTGKCPPEALRDPALQGTGCCRSNHLAKGKE